MKSFDVIVIGGGHAGVEASRSAALLGHKTLLLTLNKKMIANTPCNPHIGGSAKGVVVREIDALGGLMGIAADHDPLQIKMLNTGKGPGIQCLRAQVDKKAYPAYVQECLDKVPNLEIQEHEVKEIIVENHKVTSVRLENNEIISCKAVILTTGTYMDSTVIQGNEVREEGPDGEKSSIGLASSLRKLGLKLFRLKTGTPPRIKKSSIDFSKAELEPGQDGELAFSYQTEKFKPLKDQLPCYLIYTSDETLKLIREHIDESPVFNGTIKGQGPRYCPSIESKVKRFPDKTRHQLFLEPEFKEGESIYLQGFSTGFGRDFQEVLVHTLPGLEHAEILKYAYQIEYEAIDPLEFKPSLMLKKVEGFFGAGQILGTSGYEEAASLGLMAGINACLYIENKPPFILKRNEAYIGVMIDDLVTKGTEEPYRLMSSRAEYRLLLRHDNADTRLMKYGHELGLINDEVFSKYQEKYQRINKIIDILKTTTIPNNNQEFNDYLVSKGYTDTSVGHRAIELLKRPFVTFEALRKYFPDLDPLHLNQREILSLEIMVKYEGYLAKEKEEAHKLDELEDVLLPDDLDYLHLDGLALEAREKLDQVRPRTLAQAGRISGVNPADISVLYLTLKRRGIL